MANDLLFQNFSTVQNSNQPKPNTIAAATTIAPTTFLTYVSGTTNIDTITPPVTGQHMLVFVFTNASPGQFTTNGNILVGSTTIAQYKPVLAFYDPAAAKYRLGNFAD